MSQNKLLSEQMTKAKKDIRARYLAGESVRSIARGYGVSDRNVYYHLGNLSPDDKALHAKNMDLRRIASNSRKEVSDSGEETQQQSQSEASEEGSASPASEGTTSPSSLADFVEPEGEI